MRQLKANELVPYGHCTDCGSLMRIDPELMSWSVCRTCRHLRELAVSMPVVSDSDPVADAAILRARKLTRWRGTGTVVEAIDV